MKFLLNVTCCVLLAMALDARALETIDDSDTGGATEVEAATENVQNAESLSEAGDLDAQVAGTEAESILDRPLDGSSVESFQAGLDRVEQEASEEEYRQLMSSISFLLFYDLGAKRDKATLYSRLNGKSPQQIIDRVQNHRAGK